MDIINNSPITAFLAHNRAHLLAYGTGKEPCSRVGTFKVFIPGLPEPVEVLVDHEFKEAHYTYIDGEKYKETLDNEIGWEFMKAYQPKPSALNPSLKQILNDIRLSMPGVWR